MGVGRLKFASMDRSMGRDLGESPFVLVFLLCIAAGFGIFTYFTRPMGGDTLKAKTPGISAFRFLSILYCIVSYRIVRSCAILP